MPFFKNHSMNFVFIGLFYLLRPAIYLCDEELNKTIENKRNCRERNRLITTNKGDIYKLVDAIPQQKLILQCHYCKEQDDQQPKIWYKMENFEASNAHEVNLGMDSNYTRNRIHVNFEHSLIFRNVTLNDSGFYYCLGLEGQEAENKYNFLVDIVLKNEIAPQTGNLTTWKKYHEEYFMPINKLLATSTDPDYLHIRDILQIQMEVVTEWESWGPCEICNRPQGEGQKRKKGLCRLKLTPLQKNQTAVNVAPKNPDEAFLLKVYELSCRSLVIARLFPVISTVTRLLPDFIQTEPCEGTCTPDAEGLSKGWKTGKTMGFKYKKTYVLAQDAHLILICPESTLENVVVWRRNGKILKAGESVPPPKPDQEPRITVDTFNTLYFHGVTGEEEGNYTCQVDEIRMQQIRIYVVSKTRLLTQAFVRHMMYLGFVLCLTLSCYCAGLFITWKRRFTFKGYEELVEENQKKFQGEEEEEADEYDDDEDLV